MSTFAKELSSLEYHALWMHTRVCRDFGLGSLARTRFFSHVSGAFTRPRREPGIPCYNIQAKSLVMYSGMLFA